MEEYHPIVRPALLTGFLGYLFAVIGLIADLGRPWNLWVPMVGSYGTTSVMFEVAWCVAIYTTVLFLEFSPSLLEWLGLNKFRAMILKATLGLTILGMVLSTLHQSSLGALFLMAPTKLHPLWYSTYIPVFFFISSMCAGIGMVMVESGLAHHAFRHRIDPAAHVDLDELTLGLAKAGAVVLFAYFFLKLQGLADGGRWDLLATPYGLWYLVEVVGFVLLPSLLFAYGARNGKASFVRWVAAWVVLGVVINRLNVSVIAMNWESADRYVPAVMEILTSLAIITTGVMVYRWIVNRMPVLAELPEYRGTSH
jgi:Ni/Fe-hydrogenase subunit HybB-like protein